MTFDSEEHRTITLNFIEACTVPWRLKAEMESYESAVISAKVVFPREAAPVVEPHRAKGRRIPT